MNEVLESKNIKYNKYLYFISVLTVVNIIFQIIIYFIPKLEFGYELLHFIFLFIIAQLGFLFSVRIN